LNRKQILNDAANAVLRDRNATHGKPENSFGTIAKLWGVFIDKDIEPWQVAIMLGLLKVARAKGNPTNADNFVDLAGYAACGGELAHSDKVNKVAKEMISRCLSEGASVGVINTEAHNGAYYPTTASVSYISKDDRDNGEPRIAYVEDHEEIAKRGVITIYLDLPHPCTEDEAIEFGKKFIKEKKALVQI
jgi:hypothetical protein